MTIYVDNTHLGRHVTGLERITLELFSADALAPLDIVPVTARGTRQMLTTQTLGLPMRLATPSSILVCPGFPPSPAAAAVRIARVALYPRRFPDDAARRTQRPRAAVYGRAF